MGEFMPLIYFIAIIAGFTMFINIFVSKRNLKLVFVMPSIITVIAVVVLASSFITRGTSDGWAALGLLALGVILFVSGMVSYLVSTLMYFSYKSDLKKQDAIKKRTR